jgi:hypothetical protein
VVSITLEAPIGPQHAHVGPEPYFQVEADKLKKPSGETIAVYKNGLWVADSASYVAISVELPARVIFKGDNGPTEHGPFTRTRFVDGALWVTTDSVPILMAHFDGLTNLWMTCTKPHVGAGSITILPADGQ